MPQDKLKVVTIITTLDARERLLNAFAKLGVRGFSASHVEGMGRHGERRSGLTGTKNILYTVVATEPLSARLLAWVEEGLLPEFPSIAYSTDAVAIAGAPIN